MRINFNIVDETLIENINSQHISNMKSKGWNIQPLLDKDGFFLTDQYSKEGINKEQAFGDIKEVFQVEPQNAVLLRAE